MREGVIKSCKDSKVFHPSYSSAMDVINLTKRFPGEEVNSLTDQMRRSSSSVAVNIVEGWAKGEYQNVFRRQLVDAEGSCEETKLWLRFALDCGQMFSEDFKSRSQNRDEVGRMFYGLHDNWKTYK